MSLTVRWTRQYPAWSARHERCGDGSQTWIAHAWWVQVRLTTGGDS